VAKGDNPFGSDPPSNPFGSPPSTDPFGRPIEGSDDAFDAPGPAEPSSQPSPGDAWRAPPAPRPTGGDAAPPPTGGDAAPPATADGYPAAPVPGRRVDGAIPALVLGIVGIILCPLLAPVAWSLGRKAEREVDASGGTLTGRGEATAGKVIGIVGTVLMIFWVLLFLGLMAFGSSLESSTPTTTTLTL
jgi:hypothetical protein